MNTLFRATILTCTCIACFAQPNFQQKPIVQILGDNTNFEISDYRYGEEANIYMCWVNRIGSTHNSIYRMTIFPELSKPELITASMDTMCNPVINIDGDIVWQQRLSNRWVLKHYNEAQGSIETITDSSKNSTSPALSERILLFVQEDSLKYYNLFYKSGGVIDTGRIANPDISPYAYSSFWHGVYEKHSGDSSKIWECYKSRDSYDIKLYESSDIGININPQFGVMGAMVYQTKIDDTWSIGFDFYSRPLVYGFNTTNPGLFSPFVIARHEIRSELVYFSADSIPGNLEIFTSAQFGGPVYNISNMDGDDDNPKLSLFYPDSIALLWEHATEHGREIWLGTDIWNPGVRIDQHLTSLPVTFMLLNVYPNPFNPTTTISYDLPEYSHVKLTIHDVTGREVVTLQNKERPAGYYEVKWNGTGDHGQQVSTGVYFAKLQTQGFKQTIKMVYLK